MDGKGPTCRGLVDLSMKVLLAISPRVQVRGALFGQQVSEFPQVSVGHFKRGCMMFRMGFCL